MCTFAEKRVWSYMWNTMDDLSAVPEENIIDYLLDRLQQGRIYTWVGTLLLAMHPDDESLDENIYDLSLADEYVRDVTYREVVPHIFSVAARAHHRIIQGIGKSSQMIILNGETGTGKTFNALKALEFLTASATKNAFADVHRVRDLVVHDIAEKITNACRLMSAFTTASTERNKASSRHVQLVWLEYQKGNICGAQISSYLLERSRVTKGCCNFHIFNQMMMALADIEFADTGLSKDERYYMLSDSDSLKGQHFRDAFHDTLRAMDMLGFAKDQKKNILQVLSLLVHMNNIQFVQGDDRCKIDTDSKLSKEALRNTCKLARLEEEDIVELLTSILINPQSSWRRRSAYRRNLNTIDACRYRLHGIIRHLYDLLFRWLVDSTNQILSADASESNERLGLLDVFGFEYFVANGIEQLCVNYVNERSQQYFVARYLESCRKNLQEEGFVEEAQPLEIVQLYKDRLYTIEELLFATLNDMCQSTVANNTSMLSQRICANGQPVTGRFLTVNNENFIVRHYASAVEYSINDLLFKNFDKIPNEITSTFSVSTNEFLHSLINENHRLFRDGKWHVRKPTMLSKLRYNVDALIQQLNKCDVHYVRCIKPRRFDNHNWDRHELQRQLANTGILDALPLARCKYPIYFTYREFFERYCEKQIAKKHDDAMTINVACKKMLESSRLTMTNDHGSSVHCGNRLIFLTKSIYLQLESSRRQRHAECVKKLESFWIKHRRERTRATGENIKNKQQAETGAKKMCERSNFTGTSILNSSGENNDVTVISNQIDLFVTEKGISDTMNCQQQNKKKNMAGDVGAIVNTGIEAGLFVEKQHQTILSISNIDKLQENIIHVISCLKNMIRRTNVKYLKREKSLISKQLQQNDDYSEFTDIDSDNTRLRYTRYTSSRSVLFHMDTRDEKNSVVYNKEEDVYVIQHGISSFFYRNGIFSRRRLIRVPIRFHTRLTSLTNSHCLVRMQLPQGLQDCF